MSDDYSGKPRRAQQNWRPDYSTQISSPIWGNCTHETVWRKGFNSSKKQIWECATCKQSWVEERVRRTSSELIKTLSTHFKAGHGVKKASKDSGVNRCTVAKYYKIFLRYAPEQKHTCGKPILHKGTCGRGVPISVRISEEVLSLLTKEMQSKGIGKRECIEACLRKTLAS